MANEIEVRGRLTFAKTGASGGIDAAGTFTLSGTKFQMGRQNVGTSEEALILGDAAAGGWVFIKNLDATNYVSLRSGTGATDVIRINAGEFAMFRLHGSSTAPYVIANTAAVEIEYLVLVN